MTRPTRAWLRVSLTLLVIASALSIELSAKHPRTPPPPPPPPASAPTLKIISNHSHVVLDWARVEGAVGYRVFRSKAGVWDPEPVATVWHSRYWSGPLSFGVVYGYKVAAFNRGGKGPDSNAVQAMLLAPPAGLTAVAGDKQVTLSWKASAGATSYAVYRGTVWDERSFAPVANNVTALTFVDTGLTNGKKYFYRVRAIGPNTESRLSHVVYAKPLGPPTPPPAAAPQNLNVILNNGQVALTWSAVTGATSYKVFRTSNGTFGATPLATVTGTMFGEAGPPNGTTYSYRVAASNAGGDGPVSGVVSVTPTPPPAAPGGVSATPADGAVTVSWTPVTGATSYNIYRGTTANGQAASPVGAVAAPPFIDSGLTNGTTYFYKVTAVGAGGEGARSAEVSAAPQAAPPGVNPTLLSAFRLLRQSTWGPKPGEVEQIVANGVDAFLTAQLSAAPSAYPDALFNEPIEASQEHFMQLAMTGPDQLRQRVAWALHKIWVVSAVEVNSSRAIITYYRLLMNGAFGSYRDLMREVTLNPAMGRYLNMVNNRAQVVTGVPPNENYARELMQLFTIGLTTLNGDGSPVVDAQGQPVPVYTEDDVKALARILTGWTFGDGNPATVPTGLRSENYGVPMEAVAASARFHDVGAKLFLGVDFPAGQTPAQDLDQALDVLFNHPNMGPFVARQLIQQLVTSNPSPGYVSDIAAVFNGGGGTRGDLGAVIRAILKHPEAGLTSPTSGKLSEPVLFVLSQLRGLNATITNHPFMSNKVAEMGQNVLFPPSVFSYFSPGYRVRGTGTPPLMGPEFQGLTTVTALVRANFVGNVIGNRFGTDVTIDYTPFTSRAANAATLVDYVSLLFTGGQLSPATRNEIIAAVSATSATQTLERARTAIYLTLVPAQSQVDR